MLVPISNPPRDYSWGSRAAIAALEGRPPSATPEAEIWFGDHPAAPSLVDDGSGRTLDAWIAAEGGAAGVPGALPYLMKILAAESSLSIQAHPSLAQARAGFAREESAGVARDAPERNYRDENHKPEVIVALSPAFEALAGFRQPGDTRRLLAEVGGEGAREVAARLEGADASTLREVVAWLLSGEAGGAVESVIAALGSAEDGEGEFARERAVARRIALEFPGDPGVVVSLLLNLVVLAQGEALFVPAGVPHTYQSGLGVELMAASDNVLRGGLTPKHVDVAELLSVLDAEPGLPPLLAPRPVAEGVELFAPPVEDFGLLRVTRADPSAAPTLVHTTGPAIALATRGELTLDGSSGELVLRPGQACLVTPDESPLRVSGAGELFVAEPGTGAREE